MTFLPRKEMTYLENWFSKKRRKPLVLRGARQVGKSSLVTEFAKRQGLDLVVIDFERHRDFAETFNSNDPIKILEAIGLRFQKNIDIKNSLLFFDEIQHAPNVFSALRYFFEDMPELPVICAGSLLELAILDKNFTMPVGRISYLFMGPMTFQEFLIAQGYTQLVSFFKNYKPGDVIYESIHTQCLTLLKQYFIVGGMPASVREFVESNNFMDSSEVKSDLLLTYIDDFGKNANNTTKERMNLIFDETPRILGEKFKFSNISKDEKAANLRLALERLLWSRVITQVTHTDANGLPLGAEKNLKYFKLYFVDVGLAITATALNEYNLFNINDLLLVNSGKIAEQFIAQHLLYFHKPNEKPDLFYWSRESKGSSAEIDFIVTSGDKVVPIEVKAGKSGTLKSLQYFLTEKKLDLGVRFYSGLPNVTDETIRLSSGDTKKYKLLSLPLYMIEELRRILEEFNYT